MKSNIDYVGLCKYKGPQKGYKTSKQNKTKQKHNQPKPQTVLQ